MGSWYSLAIFRHACHTCVCHGIAIYTKMNRRKSRLWWPFIFFDSLGGFHIKFQWALVQSDKSAWMSRSTDLHSLNASCIKVIQLSAQIGHRVHRDPEYERKGYRWANWDSEDCLDRRKIERWRGKCIRCILSYVLKFEGSSQTQYGEHLEGSKKLRKLHENHCILVVQRECPW